MSVNSNGYIHLGGNIRNIYILALLLISLVFPDSCNMEIVGHLAFDQGLSDLTGFEQDGREFAVVGLIDSVAAVFVDITEPENPMEVGSITGTPSGWRDLKYWNRHVYIGTEAEDGVKVVSVDDPDNPTIVNIITDFTNSHNIHIDDAGYLYVVGGSAADVTWIYELTDHPENPILVGTWSGEYFHDVEVYNNKLYGAAIISGLFYIIDVSDKTNPTTILSHYTGLDGLSTHDCAVTDDEQYLITADETSGGHIKIWDISDYDNINLVSEYMTHPEHSVHNVYVRPGTNLVIMSYYVDGTRVLDISDPVNPMEVGYFDTSDLNGLFDGHWGTYAYLPSGYIISSDRQNGLFIFSSPLTDSSMEWSACDDCAGVPNGDSWESDCGCVAGDNSGDACDDCAGVPNGDAVEDECGVCGGDGIPENECDCDGNIDDCAGECGGDAIVDGIDCSGVSLEVQNVDTGVGTLDIYMSNYSGCSYCADSTFNSNTQDWTDKKEHCEYYGDTTWVAYDPITEAECAAIPSIDENGGWWFNGEVGGFQFQLTNIEITDAFGGTAFDAGFTVSTLGTDVPSGISKVLGFSLSGGTIPSGSGILTQVTFTDFEGQDICFGEDTHAAGNTVVSDGSGEYVGTIWGECYSPQDEIYGCTDELAGNYNPDATVDDGSCFYCDLGDVNCDGSLNVLDIVIASYTILAVEYDEIADVNGDGELNILDLVTLVNWVLFGNDSACIDYDGNTYETVQIGEQLWMAENLKVTHYNDGSEISYPSEEWGSDDEGQYAVYDNDPLNADIYGNLYNWAVVNDDRGVCPAGWHIPSLDEGSSLIDYLGADTDVVGGKMKSTGSIEDGDGLWSAPNQGATNESGFTALPSGIRSSGYDGLSEHTSFWSSTPYNDHAWRWTLYFHSSEISITNYLQERGYSIRCLKD